MDITDVTSGEVRPWTKDPNQQSLSLSPSQPQQQTAPASIATSCRLLQQSSQLTQPQEEPAEIERVWEQLQLLTPEKRKAATLSRAALPSKAPLATAAAADDGVCGWVGG